MLHTSSHFLSFFLSFFLSLFLNLDYLLSSGYPIYKSKLQCNLVTGNVYMFLFLCSTHALRVHTLFIKMRHNNEFTLSHISVETCAAT